MDTTLLIGLAFTLLAVAAAGFVWWRQRQGLARLQGLLQDAEDSRLELMDEAQALRRQLHASAAPRPQSDIAERRAAVERALADTHAAPAAGWQDTLPMVLPNNPSGFQPTQPAPLPTQPAELMRD